MSLNAEITNLSTHIMCQNQSKKRRMKNRLTPASCQLQIIWNFSRLISTNYIHDLELFYFYNLMKALTQNLENKNIFVHNSKTILIYCQSQCSLFQQCLQINLMNKLCLSINQNYVLANLKFLDDLLLLLSKGIFD